MCGAPCGLRPAAPAAAMSRPLSSPASRSGPDPMPARSAVTCVSVSACAWSLEFTGAKVESGRNRSNADAAPRRTPVGWRLSFSTMTPRRTLGTIPNLISASRFFLAAGFVAAGAAEARIGLIGAAAVTDMLDGWLARRVKATSRWGALLDPIADRVFVLTVVGTFLFTGALSTTAYFILISRDLATAVGFLVAKTIDWLRPVQFNARRLGKIVTVLPLLTLLCVLAWPDAR